MIPLIWSLKTCTVFFSELKQCFLQPPSLVFKKATSRVGTIRIIVLKQKNLLLLLLIIITIIVVVVVVVVVIIIIILLFKFYPSDLNLRE